MHRTEVPGLRGVRGARTRYQSLSVSSPSASARMTRVEACEPELPPLEIMRGDEERPGQQPVRFLFSKYPIAVAVSYLAQNSSTSQPARLRIIFANGNLQIGFIEELPCRQSFECPRLPRASAHVQHVVRRNNAHQPAIRFDHREHRCDLPPAEHGHSGIYWSRVTFRATKCLSINSAMRAVRGAPEGDR